MTVTHTPSRTPTPGRQTSINTISSRESLRDNTRLSSPAGSRIELNGKHPPAESRIELNGKHPLTVMRPTAPRTVPDRRSADTFSDRAPFSSSRYRDGRTAVYRGPEPRSPRNDTFSYAHHTRDRYDRPNRRPYYFDPWTFRYYPRAFTPVFYGGPVVAPVTGFGISWSRGTFGVSFGSYYPVYSRTRYYDSWYGCGWNYSNLYYDGWRHGWYGGISYICNPWPVYRTYYLYEPAPVYTETVYVTQPATAATIIAPPATVAASVPSAPATADASENASPAQQIETDTEGCFCPCHCNGQRPCTCDYPCGSEYAVNAEDFNLRLGYESYAESLNAETIWASYAGLDRWDPDAVTPPAGLSAAIDISPY